MSPNIDALGEQLTAEQTAERFTAYVPANERARFEAHAHDECLLLTRNADGAYAECDTRAAWIAWCAALGGTPAVEPVESAQVAPDKNALLRRALQDAEAGLVFAGADVEPAGDFVPTPTLALRAVRAALTAEPVKPQEPAAPREWSDEWLIQRGEAASAELAARGINPDGTVAALAVKPPAQGGAT